MYVPAVGTFKLDFFQAAAEYPDLLYFATAKNLPKNLPAIYTRKIKFMFTTIIAYYSEFIEHFLHYLIWNTVTDGEIVRICADNL